VGVYSINREGNQTMTAQQYNMILKVLSNSPLYEAHKIEELKNAIKELYNQPCGMSVK